MSDGWYAWAVQVLTWAFKDIIGVLVYIPLAIGAFHLVQTAFRIYWVFWRYTSRLGVQDLYSLYKSNSEQMQGGTWVLITGAPGAFGTGFAEEFAQLGFNVLMVSRSSAHLVAARDSLSKKYPTCEVRIHEADFNSKNFQTPQQYLEFFSKIMQDIDVAIIIPCCGVCHAGFFSEMPEYYQKEMLSVNLVHPILLTTAVALPYFERRAASTGSRCALIYPSSTFDEQESSPGFALYGATKLGLSQFAQSVKDSTADTDVLDVMLIRMGAIKSRLSKAKESFLTPAGRVAAHGCMEDLGKHYVTHGFMTHNYIDWLTSIVFRNLPTLANSEQLHESFDYQKTH